MKPRRKWRPEDIPDDDLYELTIPQVAALTNRSEAAVRRLFDLGLIRWWFKNPEKTEGDEEGRGVRVTTRAEIARYQLKEVQLQEQRRKDHEEKIRNGSTVGNRGRIHHDPPGVPGARRGVRLSQKEFSRQFLR